MITILGTALVNWNALGKITLAALIGGTGVVIVFGFLLLGISRGRTANSPTQRFALFTLSGICGVLCVAVAVIGIYAMTQKPSTAKPKPKAAAALAPAATARRLATGPRVE
jgi:NADH:ubiquinone oxidoreductase subunit 6 (subunit J)